MAERRFWLTLPQGLLWGVLTVAILYFVWLLLIAGRVVVIRRGQQFIDPIVWVWVGLGVFGIALLLGILALIPGRGRAGEEDLDEGADAIPAGDEAYAPRALEPQAPAVAGARNGDVEIRAVGEEYKGRRVLEVSIPPKSTHRGAVYAKAYVPVDEALVIRVEDLVADRADVA